MLNFLKALILLPVAVLVVLLAVANRGPVTVSLDPFSREVPEIAFTVPLFALIFLAVMLGVVIGGVGAWLAQGKHRRAERLYKREARRLRADTVRARPVSGSSELATLPGSGSSRF
jgi:Lipopolysaccharide assembly protein A domain